VFPGCDRPPPWTDAHHLVHWLDNGPSKLDNLVLLCPRHHTFLHENMRKRSEYGPARVDPGSEPIGADVRGGVAQLAYERGARLIMSDPRSRERPE
jgi:hypothetical protein